MTKSPARRARTHHREFLADTLTPLGVYTRLATLSPCRFLLESVTGGDQVSRYSFLGSDPWGVYRLFPDRIELETRDSLRTIDGPPLENLRSELSRIEAADSGLPFSGGFVGYFGYDFGRLIERLPNPPPDHHDLPLAILGRFDSVVVFDHAQQKITVVSNEIDGEVDKATAIERLEVLSDLLTQPQDGSALSIVASDVDDPVQAEVSLDDGSFQERVRIAKEHIAEGDIYQVVLARRWHLSRAIRPLSLYRALRVVNPSPYMVLFETSDVSLVGASPEMLVKKSGSRLETRPIAGTRPRSEDPEKDRRLAKELLSNLKERAEHVMLVDLGRNDVGRVSKPGTVRLPSFMEIERYSHVMHIVSSVEGELSSKYDAFDALLACFPAGTVSGAPKIRAMEIIDRLEPEARGPYAGAVGYLSFDGDLDTCITIRTLVIHDDGVSFTAGAGIVFDSDPEAETLETENKAEAMKAAIELACRLDAASVARSGKDR